jgi:hypothetical protein
MLGFERHHRGRTDRTDVAIDTLIVAGWTGRDEAALRQHIIELGALGIRPPSSMPVFYRISTANLTQARRLQVLGPDTSGEVEPVIVSLSDGLWLAVGSDHTDRKAEAVGIALSKQLCSKVLGTALWRLDDVAAHWDRLVVRAFATIEGARILYQEGALAAIRPLCDLLGRLPGGPELAPGTMMFCGTIGAIGGIRPASRFEMELEDPVRGLTMTHAYDVEALPVVT